MSDLLTIVIPFVGAIIVSFCILGLRLLHRLRYRKQYARLIEEYGHENALRQELKESRSLTPWMFALYLVLGGAFILSPVVARKFYLGEQEQFAYMTVTGLAFLIALFSQLYYRRKRRKEAEWFFWLILDGRMKAALAFAKKELENRRNDPMAWLRLALVRARTGEIDMSLQAYNEAVDLSGEKQASGFISFGEYVAGWIAWAQDDIQTAISHLEASVSAVPRSIIPRIDLVRAHIEAGNISDARVEIAVIQDIFPLFPNPHPTLLQHYADTEARLLDLHDPA